MTFAYEGSAAGPILAAYQYDELGRRVTLNYRGSSSSYNMSFSYETLVNFTGGADGAHATVLPYETTNRLSELLDSYGGSSVTLQYGRNKSGQITNLSADNSFFLPEPTAYHNNGYNVNRLNEYTATGASAGTDGSGNPIVQGAHGKIIPIDVDQLSFLVPMVAAGHSPTDSSVDPGGSTIVYDLNDNMRRWTGPDGTRNVYTYDAENRLRTATTSANTIGYDYDALGRRISKTVNGVTTGYLLDGDEEIAERQQELLLLQPPGFGDRNINHQRPCNSTFVR